MAFSTKRKGRSGQPAMLGGRVGPVALIFLLALLVLPALALRHGAAWIDWKVGAGFWTALNLATYILYRSDKRRAEAGLWRIPESTLHIAELLGGWAAAYLAQRHYRHKTAKVSYQVVFWIIVAVHQFVAADFLSGWKLFSRACLFIKHGTS